jgi:hypothetical protein
MYFNFSFLQSIINIIISLTEFKLLNINHSIAQAVSCQNLPKNVQVPCQAKVYWIFGRQSANWKGISSNTWLSFSVSFH